MYRPLVGFIAALLLGCGPSPEDVIKQEMREVETKQREVEAIINRAASERQRTDEVRETQDLLWRNAEESRRREEREERLREERATYRRER